MLNMFLNSSVRSIPNIIRQVDVLECLTRRTDSSNEVSHHTKRSSRELLAQEVKIMDAWKQSLEDCDIEDAHNRDGDIKIEDEESELD